MEYKVESVVLVNHMEHKVVGEVSRSYKVVDTGYYLPQLE